MTNIRGKKPTRSLLAALGLHMVLLGLVLFAGRLMPEPAFLPTPKESSIQVVAEATPDPRPPAAPAALPPVKKLLPEPSDSVFSPPAAQAIVPDASPEATELAEPITGGADPARGTDPTPTETAIPPLDALPKAGEIQMQAYLGRYQLDSEPLGAGSLTVVFPAPDRYVIRLTAQARGWAAVFVRDEVSFYSEGKLTADGLVPESFASKTPFRGTVRSQFDSQTQKAILQETQAPVDLPPGFQDRLSVIFQLAWIGQTRPQALDYGARHTLTVAGSRNFRAATFSVEGRDDLVLPGGILVSAIRLVSDPIQGRREGHIEVWLDPSDRYLPARMLFQETTGQAVDFLAIRPVF